MDGGADPSIHVRRHLIPNPHRIHLAGDAVRGMSALVDRKSFSCTVTFLRRKNVISKNDLASYKIRGSYAFRFWPPDLARLGTVGCRVLLITKTDVIVCPQVGAHGTGASIPPVDEQVVSMKLVTPSLGTVELSNRHNPDLFRMAKVNGRGCSLEHMIRQRCDAACASCEKSWK